MNRLDFVKCSYHDCVKRGETLKCYQHDYQRCGIYQDRQLQTAMTGVAMNQGYADEARETLRRSIVVNKGLDVHEPMTLDDGLDVHVAEELGR